MPRVAPVTRARRSARRRELLMVSVSLFRQPRCQGDLALPGTRSRSHCARAVPWVLLCADCSSTAREALLAGGSWATFFASHRAAISAPASLALTSDDPLETELIRVHDRGQ